MISIASIIDHTLLEAGLTRGRIEQLCTEALEHQFAAICIPPYFVDFAKGLLEESDVKVSTVVGYPLGFESTGTKIEEIKRAIDMGVDELDVVIHLAAVKNKDWTFVKNDIESMTRACHMKGKVIKVILETHLLNSEELEKLCAICNAAEVDFVKTSTGRVGGATVEVVSSLRKQLEPKIKIKASGGIRSLAEASALLDAGANRIGTSSGISLIKEI